MRQPKRVYVSSEGKEYPLYEAPYQYPVMTYKKDCRSAQVANPENCLIARGALRDKAVEAVYIGSSKDAYVCFKATKLREAYALHFTINAKAAAVRDYFDTHKGITTKQVILSPPTAGRTLEHRSKLNKQRREEIKAGAEKKKRNTPRSTRIDRIGVHYRPKAKIMKNNVIAMPVRKDDEAAA